MGFHVRQVPLRFEDKGHAGLCRAAMTFEEEVVRRLGGRLLIERRIPEGAPKCAFRVVKS